MAVENGCIRVTAPTSVVRIPTASTVLHRGRAPAPQVHGVLNLHQARHHHKQPQHHGKHRDEDTGLDGKIDAQYQQQDAAGQVKRMVWEGAVGEQKGQELKQAKQDHHARAQVTDEEAGGIRKEDQHQPQQQADGSRQQQIVAKV